MKTIRARSELGFTLIEMLVVIALIGIVAAVASISIAGMKTNASLEVCRHDRQIVEIAAIAMAADEPGGPYRSIDALIAAGYLKDKGNLRTAFEDPDPVTGLVTVSISGKYGPIKVGCETN